MFGMCRHRLWLLTAVLLPALLGAASAPGPRILFIGNSFTFAFGSPARYYRPDSVVDLNSEGQGGVPALFKSFTVQAGLHYDVALETHPGVGLDWHLQHKRALLTGRAWDQVVMHGYSTLDPVHPGDPALLIDTVRQLSALLHAKNPAVTVRLLATWPRADETYGLQGAWHGKPIEAMAADVREGYRRAAEAPGIAAVIPVGDSWVRAMHEGVADPDPYDGLEPGKVNLWADDSYHASIYGSYLEALMVFGAVTGRDPRGLGQAECSAFELGLSVAQVEGLERVASEQLAAEGLLSQPSLPAARSGAPQPCTASRR